MYLQGIIILRIAGPENNKAGAKQKNLGTEAPRYSRELHFL